MKVLTFSRYFPKGHSKQGQLTYFVEKVEACLADTIPGWEISKSFTLHEWDAYYNCTMPKHHTIRVGKRWKAGDMASLRVWSGYPYRSKQVEFAQVEVKRVWQFNIHVVGDDLIWQVPGSGSGPFDTTSESLKIIAANDGLEIRDFIDWFAIHPKAKGQVFSGQIICWSDKINYQ